jgi:hypothetical protein
LPANTREAARIGGVHETPEDLRALQALLDASHTAGGSHLRTVFSDDRRLSAGELSERLTGVCVLDLATVTAKGEPRVAPVDGLFLRGQWHFGTAPDAARARHLTARPAVSAAHTRGEDLAVVVHGKVRLVSTAEGNPLRAYPLEVYGEQWLTWGHDGAPYWVIEADRMFSFKGVSE